MAMKHFVLSFLCCAFFLKGHSQKRMTVTEYIEKYRNDAISDMQKTGVPASITMAQALLESDNGNSPLALEANNHFGIKCHEEWKGQKYFHDDDLKQECFRVYRSARESFQDHSNFLHTRDRYASLFKLPKDDYKSWAYGLKKAGYATNPKYPQMIIKLIEENHLDELDKGNTTLPVAAAVAVNTPTKPKEDNTLRKTLSTGNYRENGPRVLVENDVKYIIARNEDSYLKIANEFELGLWQIYKYNEIDKDTPLSPGQRIYIQPKRRKASVNEHFVKPGETVYSIAQQYAIKSKRIYKLNDLQANTSLQTGQRLLLQ